jgi:hypothetical protein
MKLGQTGIFMEGLEGQTSEVDRHGPRATWGPPWTTAPLGGGVQLHP